VTLAELEPRLRAIFARRVGTVGIVTPGLGAPARGKRKGPRALSARGPSRSPKPEA
jgi:hypothetical protein